MLAPVSGGTADIDMRIRKGAYVDVVDVGPRAQVPVVGLEGTAVLRGECLSLRAPAVGTGHEIVADRVIALGVLVGNCPGSDQTYPHGP